MPCATITQTVPRRLHSMQTLVDGMLGRRPCRNAVITSSSWRLLIGQPLQLEVDRDVRGDRRRGLERRDVARASRRRVEMKSSTSAKLRSAWMPPAVAQAPIVTSCRDDAPHLLDPLGVVRRGDRALDQREVVRALDRRAASPRGSRRSRPRRRARAARPRSRAARAGSRRRRRTSRRRASACRRGAHSSRTASSALDARRSGTPGRRGRSASGRAGSGRSGRRRSCMLRSSET